MKKIIIAGGMCLVLLTVSGLAFFKGNYKTQLDNYLFKKKAQDALASYVDQVVIETIQKMCGHIYNFETSARELDKSRSQAAFDNVVADWKAIRDDYMQSQIFMYGPAALFAFHKQLAIWPVDKILLEHAIEEINQGKKQATAQALRDQPASTRGLYAAQYLLFNRGIPRSPDDLSDTQLAYLSAIAAEMKLSGLDFLASWVGTDNMPADQRKMLSDAQRPFRSSFAWEVNHPGLEKSRYFSISIPIQEQFQEDSSVIEDMLAIFEEDLIDRKQGDLNYWESIDPCQDLQGMLKGIDNAYACSITGESAKPCFYDLVAGKDKVLADHIRTNIIYLSQRIDAIKKAAPKNRKQTIKLAIKQLDRLATTLTAATALVAIDPALEPFACYGSDLKYVDK
nr:imelysin family protein [uncultured Desulfobacter sp.]